MFELPASAFFPLPASTTACGELDDEVQLTPALNTIPAMPKPAAMPQASRFMVSPSAEHARAAPKSK
jgi:hypothetical protein